MSETPRAQKAAAEGIPVLYIEPDPEKSKRKLAIFIHGLSGTKGELVPYLNEIAGKGYLALSFDKYQHGERGNETASQIMTRVSSNHRRYGWPILGQTILDTQRVIDWALETFQLLPEVHIGGISMGGDISIGVAGIDSRIVRVAPVVASPDWLRPGMRKLHNPAELQDGGTPDSYSQFFYDQFNPMSHLGHYVNCPPMRFFLGKGDTHIPDENAKRFRSELAKLSPKGAENVEITYVENERADHFEIIRHDEEWWPMLKEWWLP